MFRARRKIQENSGPLADLAFMLLFFFMVTTNIEQETGIPIELPPKDAVAGTSKKVLSILLNANNEVMIDGEIKSLSDCREIVLSQILEFDELSIQLKTNHASNYNSYILLYDAVRAAYIALYDLEANKHYGKPYHILNNQEKQSIKKNRPMRIMEQEYVASAISN